jgi:hypothetical protein
MEKLKESCPWCRKEVWVEAGRECRYSCSHCKKEFNFKPDSHQMGEKGPTPGPTWVKEASLDPPSAALSEFVETPIVKELVHRALAYIENGLHVHFCGREDHARPASSPTPGSSCGFDPRG